jgi:hypothetical protein
VGAVPLIRRWAGKAAGWLALGAGGLAGSLAHGPTTAPDRPQPETTSVVADDQAGPEPAPPAPSGPWTPPPHPGPDGRPVYFARDSAGWLWSETDPGRLDALIQTRNAQLRSQAP